MIVLVALIIWAYLEVTHFLYLADEIGWLTTLAVTLLTGVVGVAVARTQGLRVLLDARRQLDEGQMPLGALIDGLMIFIAGVLLIVPGLICDVFGILLLIPPVRQLARRAVVQWWQRRVRRGDIQVYSSRSYPSSSRDDVIEGQVFEGRIEQQDDAGKRPED